MPNYRTKLIAEIRTTAGNYNISTKRLGNLEIIAPTIEMQSDFQEKEHQIFRSLETINISQKNADNLFNSLLQRAFKGEL